ncbi:39S ribosomal protein L46, mitochondrial [Zeugodacus cucurbitae]|uniref:39S ribosomal protein L46, mitochondrial n=1 Tax=Zeugodacus cucurbitae TaxID=28588 RepID=UPI0005967DE1|nr:39S ribosomal protein L46, mitochondrial [Zeugodacus cucurbitae]
MYRKITTNLVRFASKSLPSNNASIIVRSMSATPVQSKSSDSWDLYASVLVERLPIVSKSFNAIEREFQEQLWRIEFENSLKSDHELKHERDLKQSELIKKGKMEVDLDDSASKQTAQDLKDAYSEELKSFQFALRSTSDDATNKTNSTNRCLEDTLYLVIEESLSKKTVKMLPQGPRLDGETMRQAAERVLREKCGTQLDVTFYGNAPCGFYKYKYPSEMRKNSIGAKVFFYRASLHGGNVDTEITKKFEWLTRPALEEKLQKSEYTESIQKFLL